MDKRDLYNKLCNATKTKLSELKITDDEKENIKNEDDLLKNEKYKDLKQFISKNIDSISNRINSLDNEHINVSKSDLLINQYVKEYLTNEYFDDIKEWLNKNT